MSGDGWTIARGGNGARATIRRSGRRRTAVTEKKKKKSRSRSDRTGALLVRNSAGKRHPFLRGMITHDLVQRGMAFDDAYAAARAIRDRLGDREEISTAEIRDLIHEQLEVMFPGRILPPADRSGAKTPWLMVGDPGESPQPFSRGLLARSLYATGVDFDRAYRLVGELEAELRQESVETLGRLELAARVAELLERSEGAGTAARYRLMRRVQRLEKPLVIYLGGASGTGKSTMALELAPLFRIYRVNATDTIRQVMRMVFAPAILPAIHRSSFETEPRGPLAAAGSSDDDDSESRVIASFEEQAIRVCVGVRAIVERSLAENLSVFVEGVHLVPPLVPFSDLVGAAYQLTLILTTLDEEVHRGRFVVRGVQGRRQAGRYLDSFRAIRTIQGYILRQTEREEVPLLDTTDLDSSVDRALRLLTGSLQQALPWLAEPVAVVRRVPTLVMILDGLPDRPVRSLGGRTPLQAANVPTLDRLAAEGQVGLADPVAPDVVPDTASGSLAIFGQSPRALSRGAVEAIGSQLEVDSGDIALRANFATVDDRGWIVDRRAGRIRDGAKELAEALDGMRLSRGGLFNKVEVKVRNTTEHRLAVVLPGEGLSPAVHGSDPGDGAPAGPPLVPEALDANEEAAQETAGLLAKFEERARTILAEHPINRDRIEQGLPPANAILSRGAGRVHRLEPLSIAGRPAQLTTVSGDRTLLGLARWLGSEVVYEPSMTANLDTDVDDKLRCAELALAAENDLVVVHLKGADIAAHDRRADLKVEFIERVDAALGRLLERFSGPMRLAVTSDHTTLSELGHHAADPVPVVIWGDGVEADEVTDFDEVSAAHGKLSRFPLQLLLTRLLDLG